MKEKKIRDIIIGCLLISSLAATIFIVSCSDQENLISSFTTDRSSPYHQHVHGLRGPVTDPITATFVAVGQGAAREVGSVAMGWALGAMGLTGASGPDWQKEFNTINNDLYQIIGLLQEADNELESINSVLNGLNCTDQTTSLQTEIGSIDNALQSYNTIMGSFYGGDTAQYPYILSFVNTVIQGNLSNVSISTALSNIKTNMTNPSASVIKACEPTILPPANGTFRSDSIYYLQAQSLLNYYYYYQTIGLGLLSEAYHWQAWVAAGSPGSGSGYSADSIQNVCNDTTAFYDCDYVVNESNTQYNTLLLEFVQIGAPYTGEDLLYQKNTNGENIVWVRSIEDYTAQSGANCNYPLNMNNLCGPTVGKFGNSAPSYTTYYGTQNFINPSYNELNGLVNPTPALAKTENVGNFLDSVGFENMNVNPPKVLIADTLIKLTSTGNDFNYYIDTMTVIPFISPGYPLFTVEDSHNNVYQRAIYSELYDFIGYNSAKVTEVAMYYTGYHVMSPNPCQNEGVRGIQTSWSVGSSPGPYPWAGKLGSAAWIQFCQNWNNGTGNYDIHPLTPFTWNSSYSPGWSYYSKNSVPQNAFLIPVRTNFSGIEGCLPGHSFTYENINVGGFITMCGQDFQNYLNLNLPAPPTCDATNFPNANPLCTTLP